MNTARIGAETERHIANDLRARGFIVTRSAASKGIWDLVAVGLGEVLFVQCKRTRAQLAPAERVALLNAAGRIPRVGRAVVATRPEGTGTIFYRLLYGTQAHEWIDYTPDDCHLLDEQGDADDLLGVDA